MIERLENILTHFRAKAEQAFFANDQLAEDFWAGRIRGLEIALKIVKEENGHSKN